MSVGILSGLLQYFPKKSAIIVQIQGRKKLTESLSSYFMTKKRKKKRKVLWALSPRVGGRAGVCGRVAPIMRNVMKPSCTLLRVRARARVRVRVRARARVRVRARARVRVRARVRARVNVTVRVRVR